MTNKKRHIAAAIATGLIGLVAGVYQGYSNYQNFSTPPNIEQGIVLPFFFGMVTGAAVEGSEKSKEDRWTGLAALIYSGEGMISGAVGYSLGYIAGHMKDLF